MADATAGSYSIQKEIVNQYRIKSSNDEATLDQQG